MEFTDALNIVSFKVFLQEISLAQASQCESIDEHGHLMLKFKLSDLIMLKKINGSEAWALMTSGVALLPMNTNLGRNMRMEMDT